MNAPRRIRILCVDDHPEIRRLFELVMRDHQEFELVGTTPSADELEALVEELGPDVVVLDISMNGRDPLEALKAVRSRVPDVRFLVCSSWDDEEIIGRAMAAGATGYLVKDGVFDELTQAIRTVAKNERVLPRRPGGRR
jgi:DNA-binding NarL/FixJ family response regulator